MYRRSKQLYFYVDHVFDRECRLFLFFFLEEQVKNQYFCRYNVKVFHLTPRHLFISPNCFQILNSTVFAVATEKWYWHDFLKYYIKRHNHVNLPQKYQNCISYFYILYLIIYIWISFCYILHYVSVFFPEKTNSLARKGIFFLLK